jgi:hypothetical protein
MKSVEIDTNVFGYFCYNLFCFCFSLSLLSRSPYAEVYAEWQAMIAVLGHTVIK